MFKNFNHIKRKLIIWEFWNCPLIMLNVDALRIRIEIHYSLRMMYSTSLLSRKFKSLPTPTFLHTVHCKDEDSDIFSKIFEYLKKNISQKKVMERNIYNFYWHFERKNAVHTAQIFLRFSLWIFLCSNRVGYFNLPKFTYY